MFINIMWFWYSFYVPSVEEASVVTDLTNCTAGNEPFFVSWSHLWKSEKSYVSIQAAGLYSLWPSTVSSLSFIVTRAAPSIKKNILKYTRVY